MRSQMKAKSLIVLIVLVLCGPVLAVDSWLFGSADAFVDMSDDAALTMGTGPWTLVCWVRVTSNTGTDANWLLSWGEHSASPSCSILVYEVGHANSNKIRINIEDPNGDSAVGPLSVATPGADLNVWHHCAWVKTGTGTNTLLTFYYDGAFDSNNVSGGDYDTTDVAAVMKFGDRTGDLGDRHKGNVADIGFWDIALPLETIEFLAGGCTANSFLTNMQWYIPAENHVDDEALTGIVLTPAGGATTEAQAPGVAACAVVEMTILVPLDKSGGKSNFKNGGKQ